MRVLLVDDLRTWTEAESIAIGRYPEAFSALTSTPLIFKIVRDLDSAVMTIESEPSFDVLLMDHDLGDINSDGSDVLKFLLERCLDGKKTPPKHIFAVSSNPAGIKKIDGYANDFKKLLKETKMKTFKVRKYDSETMAFSEVEMTTKEIIENPYGLHMSDIGVALLNDLRQNAGLEPINEKSVSG